MNVTILDGYTSNPGDVDWAELESLGQLTVYDRTSPEETIQRAKGSELILTNKTGLPRNVIEALKPELRYIGVLATGYNVVDIEAATEHGITVTNIPGYSTPSVVQMVFAHLLNLTQHVTEHSQGVHDGQWSNSIDFCYWDFPLVELSGKTMGILGYGQIGSAVAKVAQAFGMNVLVNTRSQTSGTRDGHAFTDMETLFRESDVISLHCPLTDDTHHIINQDTVTKMKPSAYLINTGRGGLIDENALAEALNKNRIAGAGLDVLSSEPPTNNNPLLNAKNCYITPHIAWATKAARKRLLHIAFENAKGYVDGNPLNVVNRL